MGKLAKALAIAGIVVALKGSYHLGKTARDSRYAIERDGGLPYVVDKASGLEARLDEARSINDQPAFCAAAMPYEHPLGGRGYLDGAADYVRRLLE